MKISDFPEITTLNDDDLLLACDINGITKKLKASTLKAYLGTASSGVDSGSLPLLTFASSGDDKGMIYWLATRDGSSFSNPHTSGKLIVSNSGGGSVANIVDRSAGGGNYTSSTANSYWQIDFKTHKLKPNYYSIRKDANDGYAPVSWKLQGSNDGSTFTDLDTQSNNSSLNSAFSWLSIPLTGITTSYRTIRIQLTATNNSGTWEFCCSELEFYGQVEVL